MPIRLGLLAVLFTAACLDHGKQTRLFAAARSGDDRAAPDTVVVFEGSCDASGAVPLQGALFAVADDENNVIRVYNADRGGRPLARYDLSDDLELSHKKHAEADLEAATRIADRAFWISSHARSKEGKPKSDRLRFFATELPRPGRPPRLIGSAYRNLLDDLLADPALRAFDLEQASERAPGAAGGLNIEGMTAMPDGKLLLGFRNLAPNGQALLVPMLDPNAPVRGGAGALRPPILLDLGGLGVRALAYRHGEYWIAAGRSDDVAEARLYHWSGAGSAANELKRAALADINPEAFFMPEARDAFLVLSDDGRREIHGAPCKKLDGHKHKRFRGVWIRP